MRLVADLALGAALLLLGVASLSLGFAMGMGWIW
jgi:hypothetical protein